MTLQGFTPTHPAAIALEMFLNLHAKSPAWAARTNIVSTDPDTQRIYTRDPSIISPQDKPIPPNSSVPPERPYAVWFPDERQSYEVLVEGGEKTLYIPAGVYTCYITFPPHDTHKNTTIAELMEATNFVQNVLDDISSADPSGGDVPQMGRVDFQLHESPMRDQQRNGGNDRFYWAECSFEYRTATV